MRVNSDPSTTHVEIDGSFGEARNMCILQVLKDYSIKSVVDIRIWPFRSSMGSYVLSKSPDKGIQGLLAREGIAYFSFLELGNPYKGLPDEKNRYRTLVDAAGGLLTERLKGVPGPLCLLCSEKDPVQCHRAVQAEFLEHSGHEVQHIVL